MGGAEGVGGGLNMLVKGSVCVCLCLRVRIIIKNCENPERLKILYCRGKGRGGGRRIIINIKGKCLPLCV